MAAVMNIFYCILNYIYYILSISPQADYMFLAHKFVKYLNQEQ